VRERKKKTANKFPDFPEWLRRSAPSWTWDRPHQKILYYTLERVTSGECTRLMIFMPPRHSKSETVTVRYTAWRIEREPEMTVILGSYNQKLANRFSRKVRREIEGRVEMSKERRSAEEWETKAGGGLRAAGVGGGVTGYGARLVMIDDPVKNRSQAESITWRTRTWDWFNDDIYTRLEPEGAIVLIQTRWQTMTLPDAFCERWATAVKAGTRSSCRRSPKKATHSAALPAPPFGPNVSRWKRSNGSGASSARIPLPPSTSSGRSRARARCSSDIGSHDSSIVRPTDCVGRAVTISPYR
jgi:hypothetical protein